MPRFYFHIRSGSELIEDFEGSELPDATAALQEAEAAAREIVADNLKGGMPVNGSCFEIYDEHGRKIGEFAFRDVISTDGGPADA